MTVRVSGRRIPDDVKMSILLDYLARKMTKPSAQGMTPKRAEALLTKWANLPDPETGNERHIAGGILKDFPDVFSEISGLGVDEQNFYRSIWGVRAHLRAAWRAVDERDRQWFIFRLRQLHDQHVRELSVPVSRALKDAAVARPDDGLTRFFVTQFKEMTFWGMRPEAAPPPRPFEQAMFWFQRNAEYARFCPNPDCPAPYFFSRRNKYCGRRDCVRYGQRVAGKRWWDKHGEHWRNELKKGASR